MYYSGTSDNGQSEEWTTSLQWTNCSPLLQYISTSKEGTTSEQCSSPMSIIRMFHCKCCKHLNLFVVSQYLVEEGSSCQDH